MSTKCYPIKEYRDIEVLMTKPPDRERLLFTIGFMTGLRLNEIIKLRWFDLIEIENRRPVVKDITGINISKQTKLTGKLVRRQIKIGRQLKSEILSYFRYNGEPPLDGYVFTERRREIEDMQDDHISKSTVNRMVKKYVSLYEVDTKGNVSSTILRKTFAWHYFKKNGLEMTQEALGHSNSATTLTYLGITEEAILNGYDNLYEPGIEARSIGDLVEDGELDLKSTVSSIKERYVKTEWRKELRKELLLYTSDEEDIAQTCRIVFLL